MILRFSHIVIHVLDIIDSMGRNICTIEGADWHREEYYIQKKADGGRKMAFHNFLKVVQKITHSGFDRDFREMQETETIDQVQSKDSLAEKKESSEGSGLLSSIDHNVTDAHTGYNVDRDHFSSDQFAPITRFVSQMGQSVRLSLDGLNDT